MSIESNKIIHEFIKTLDNWIEDYRSDTGSYVVSTKKFMAYVKDRVKTEFSVRKRAVRKSKVAKVKRVV